MPAKMLFEIKEEVTQLLSELIAIDTTNPPGNETLAAKYLMEKLTKEGFECEFFESEPQRGNIITRLPGTENKPKLLLLSHLDVVAANANEWSVDPFKGIIKDGYVWGRGALDMKGMTAIEVMALILLKRNRIKTKGDIILAATADEEAGGIKGADYLLNNYKEKIFAPYVLNEGGGSAIQTEKNKNIYTIQTAEKGLLWLKIKAKGIPGHGSMPEAADNAIMKINKTIQKLDSISEIKIVESMKEFLNEFSKEDSELQKKFSEILKNPEKSDEILDEIEKENPTLADEIRPRIKVTISPTMIHGGVKANVIPSECEVVFDCRILPGQKTSEMISRIKNLLSESKLDKLSYEIIQAQDPSESEMDTPLYKTIRNVLVDFDPGCGISPVLMTGGTDSRFFRRNGSVCYGFHPLRGETRFGIKPTRREHGIDERISIDNLIFGTSVLYDTVRHFMM